MIQFFPTPYPDELWYSVLCRYHVRSGNTSPAITMYELFHRTRQNGIGSLFPSNAIIKIADQFPENKFPLDKTILNNTLFNYFTRIVSYEEKEKMFQNAKTGNAIMPQYASTVSQSLVQGLRFCPICMKEDKSQYGETYWHLEHQIPLMFICRKHKCKLILYKCNKKVDLKIKFLFPEDYKENIIPDYNIDNTDIFLAEESYKYQYSPIEIRSNIEYNNIFQELLNRDFGIAPYNQVINHSHLEKELISFYGNRLVENIFGKNFGSAIMKSIRTWAYKSPERYILLAGLINQPFEVTFGPPILDSTVKKILEIKERENVYLKKDIVNELGISVTRFNVLVRKYNIERFWVNDKKNRSVSVYMTESEYKRFSNYMEKKGFTTISKFALYCMKEELNRHVLDENEKLK